MHDLRGSDQAPGTRFYDDPATFANEVVTRAIQFASQVPLPDSAAMRPNSNTLVSKHVEAQLAYYQSTPDTRAFTERTIQALEALAKACAEDGVRVKAAQAWNRDAR